MRRTLVAVILPVGLVVGTAVPVFATTSQSQTKKRRHNRNNSSYGRARNVGNGAAGGAAAGVILGHGTGAAAGAANWRDCRCASPTRRLELRTKVAEGHYDRGRFDPNRSE
jgi:photosystem II stability/assembly factor-like uncharacterized protein